MPTPTSAQRGLSEKHQRRGQGWVYTTCPTPDRGQAFFPSPAAALHNDRVAHDDGPYSLVKGKYSKGMDGSDIKKNDVQNVDETCDSRIDHAPLTSEGLRQWAMHAHVDHVFDLVPFWQRGIDAAEKGEVLRLEEFLEKMEGDGGWRTANEVLGMLGEWKAAGFEQARDDSGAEWGHPDQGDWAASPREGWESDRLDWGDSQRGWDVVTNRAASDATVSSCKENSGRGIREKRAEGPRRGNAGAGRRRGWVRAVRGDGREELRHFVDAIARQEAVTESRRREMHLFSEMSLEEKIGKIHETIQSLRKGA